MATIEVNPRPTPAERDDAPVTVEVDDALSVHAELLEDWVAPRQAWELAFRAGTDFGRANNVEAVLLSATGEQTSSLAFRLDQLDSVQDFGDELVLVFEEKDGIAKTARLTRNGADIELFHILTYT